MAVVSTRGSFRAPVLFVVDLDDCRVVDRWTYPELSRSTVPPSKQGFNGVTVQGGFVVAASWDAVAYIDPASGRLADVVSHPLFSDVHGVHEVDGRLWVASTNLDGVLAVDHHSVEPVWWAWREPALGPVLELVDRDFRSLQKHSVPNHRLHVNDVCPVPGGFVVTALGPVRRRGRLERAVRDRGLARTRQSDGCAVHIDESGRLLHRWRTDGLHDAVPIDGTVWSTEYYRGRLLGFRPGRRRPVVIDVELPERGGSTLLRGILPARDGTWWLGTTVLRGHEDGGACGTLRHHTADGRFTGREVRLPGTKGVYGIARLPGSASTLGSWP